ncbi:YadA-like family protein [Cupriavidus sp. SHE]|uniref:YadA-like family protein n=1 Tax=Cupriavidus sp. SHE TaxID=1539143 RepID=UPI00350F2D31
MGYGSSAAAGYSTALGPYATTTGNDSVAVGVQSKASNSEATAIGPYATTSGEQAIAAGYKANASAFQSAAFGTGASATATNSVALGASSTTTADLTKPAYNPNAATVAGMAPVGEVSVGSAGAERRVTNVAAGSGDTDAVNVSQLKAASTHYYSVNDGGVASGNYNNDGATGTNALAAGVNAAAGSSNSVAMGNGSQAKSIDARDKADNAIAIGNQAISYATGGVSLGSGATVGVLATNSVAIGTGAWANTNANNAVAIGGGAQTVAPDASAIGANSIAYAQSVALGSGANGGSTVGTGDVAVGYNASTPSNHGTAIGWKAVAGGDWTQALATAVGSSAEALKQGSTALGESATASAMNATALGWDSNATAVGGVAIGSNSVASTGSGVAGFVPAGVGSTQSAAIAATTGTQGAVSVGNASNGVFRQINGVAAGTVDSDAVNVAQLKAVDSKASAGWNLQANGGTASNVAPGGTVNVVNGNNINVTQNGNQLTIATADDVSFNSVTTGNTKLDTNGLTITGGPSFTTTNIDVAGQQIHGVAAGTASTDAVNVSQLTQQGGDLTAKGLNFAGNSGASVHTNLGDTLTIAGTATTAGTYSGNNLKTVTDPATGAVNLQMADNPEFTSVKTGNTTINDSGLTIAGGPSFTATNIDAAGQQIHGVAAGTASTDAVNVSQLTQQGGDLTAKGLNFAGNSGASVHTNLGDTLTITGTATTAGTYSGNNLKTVTDPTTGAVNLQMADNPEFASVKTGNTTINDSGLTINGGPSITTAGIDAGNTKIVNVAPGVAGTDAVNVDQLTAVDTKVDNVTNTVNNFAGDQSTSNTTVNGRGIRYVRTNDTGLPVSDAFAQGQGSTAVGYEAKSTGADALALGRNAQASADNSVALGANSTTTADLTTPAYNPGTGTIAGTSPVGEVSVGSAGAERRITNLAAGAADTDAVNVSQLKSATAASVADAVMYDNSTHNSVTLGGDTYNSTTKTGGTVIHNVAAGTSGGDAVNVDQLNQQGSDLTSKGLNFAGNSGTAVHTNLGDTLTIAGAATTVGTYSGNNLKTVTDPATGAVNLQMADNPEFTSVKTGNTTINDSGLTINGGPSITTAGIDAGNTKIVNVAPGVAGTDAVNVDQLTTVDTKVDNVTNTVNNFAGDQSTTNTTINGRGIRYVRTNDAGLPVSDAFAQGQGSTAVGYEAKSTGADALALGRNAQASADNSVALGANSTTTADLTTPAYNPGTGTIAGPSPVGEVSVGSAGAERRITNLAAGAADTDAVNVSQLKSATAASVADAVMYDNSTHNSVTLGGDTYNTTTKQGGTVIHNVAAGTSGGDAVNVDQLNQQGSDLTSKGLNFAGNSGASVHTNLGDTLTIAGAATTAGTYSGNNLKTVTDPATGAVNLQMADAPKFGTVTINDNGSGKITGVTAGTASTDAVNVSQLTQVADSSVKYDVDPTTGTVNYNSVTLGGDTYNTTTKTGGTVIHNVAAGTSGGDAVNVDQLNQQGSDLTSKGLNFAGNSGTAVHTNLGDTLTIAGTATTAGTYSGNNLKTVTDPATGAVQLQMADAPKFGNVTINDGGSGKITGVTAGTAATDAVNVSQLTQVADSSVKYDKNTDGTTNYNSVTLGGDTYNTTTKQGGTAIHNVAAGTSGGDAVNVDQLNQQGSDLTSKGLNFAGNSGANVHRDLGDTLTIAGAATTAGTYSGNNLKTVTDPATGAVQLQMADNPEFASVKTGNTTIDNNGVTIAGGPSITTAGIDAANTKITNVAAGTNATDAVNVSQLTQTVDASKTHYYSVNDNGVQGSNYANDGATGVNSLAAGVGAQATVAGGVALGSGSVANTAGGVAGWTPANASTASGTAITATTSTLGAVSVGDATNGQFRQITGVAAGTKDSDAVNVAQLKGVDAKVDNLDSNAVKYDDSTHNSVTLGGDTYNTITKTGGTRIKNVAAGVDGGDAVNVDQLNASKTHYYSVNDNGVQGGNYANDGATGVNALAAGVGAKATADGGVALGSGSVASTAAGVAGFVPQSASTAQGAAIAATTSTLGAVSVGDAANGQFRQITGVAAGTADSDAVNVAQLKGVDQKVGDLDNSTVKYDKHTDGTVNYNSVTLGGDTYNTTTKQGGTVIHNVAAGTSGGDAVNVDQLNTTVDASKTHYYSVNDNGVPGANYANDGATGLNAMAMGVGASASTAGGVALGAGSVASTAGGIAGWVPTGADATLANAVMGTMGTAGAVSVGNPAAGIYRQITGVAAGTSASDAVNVAQLQAAISSVDGKITPDDGRNVKYDGTGNAPKDHVTLAGDTSTDGGKTGGTTISNVHQGDVSANSTDAVNGAQLYQTNTRVDNLETTVNNWGDVINKTEGNTRYFQADGTNTDADKAYVQAGTKGVASGANASVTGNNGVAMGNTASASGNNSTAIGANTKATHDNSVALGAGSETDRANSVSVGTAGNERQITNVAAGTAATDAVNVSQLQSGLNDVQNAAINYTNQQVNNVRRDAYAGTASAMAMAALPQATLPGRGMVAMGGGTYGGQSAVALGLSKMSESGRWVFKAQATSNTRGNVGVAAGAGFHW